MIFPGISEPKVEVYIASAINFHLTQGRCTGNTNLSLLVWISILGDECHRSKEAGIHTF